MQARTVVVIGRGVAGISACLAFSKSPGKLWRVVCYDDGNELAPSRDRYKIARYDYADIETMKLALEACALLQTERYRGFCRKKLRLVVYRKNDGTYDQIAQNRKKLNLGERRVLSNKEVWSEFGIKFEEEDTINVLEEDSLLFDLSGLAESLRKECEQNGVQFFDEHVARLIYNDSRFSGVVLGDEREIIFEGAQVWVAAGPWFESLLRDSEMVMPEPERMPTCVQILAFGIEVDAPRSYPIVSILGKGECHVILLLFLLTCT
jgi:glycine/D-amino acid oxidase-like deaminating enzyme